MAARSRTSGMTLSFALGLFLAASVVGQERLPGPRAKTPPDGDRGPESSVHALREAEPRATTSPFSTSPDGPATRQEPCDGWSLAPVDSDGNAGRGTSLALDSQGYPHMSYFDRASHQLRYASWNGAGWMIQTVDSPVAVFNSLVVDSEDRPRIAYMYYSSYPDMLELRCAMWTGSAWQIVTVDNNRVAGWCAHLALETDGTPHIAYAVNDQPFYMNEEGDMRHAWLEQAVWHTETVATLCACENAIAVDPADNVAIVLVKTRLRYASRGASEWTLTTIDPDHDAGGSISLVFDGTGTAHVGYATYYFPDPGVASYVLRHARRAGSSWELRVVDDTPGQIGFKSALALDVNGAPRITYTSGDWDADPNTSELRYASFDGNNPGAPWSFCVISTGGCEYGFYNSLCFDAQNRPHVSFYRDYYEGGLMYGTGQVPGTWVVCPDGSGDFETIQDALDAVASGSVLNLCDAVFVGARNRDLNFQGKSLTMRSVNGDPNHCIIDCAFAGRGFWIHGGDGPDSVVQGVTIRNGSASAGGGVYCQDASPTIENCIISDCSAETGGGVYCESSSPTIQNCKVLDCLADTGSGIYVGWSSPSISNCTLAGCGWLSGAALQVYAGSATITGCQVTGNAAGGMEFFLCAPSTIHSCTVAGNGPGTFGGGLSFFECSGDADISNSIVWGNSGPQIWCGGPAGRPWACADVSCCDVQGGWAGENNISANPLFCAPKPWDDAPTTAGDYRLATSSPCTAEQQPACGLIGALGVGCSAPCTILACPDGSGDYTSIQAAFDAATDGDVICLCCDATFSGAGNRNVDFAGKAVTVRSECGDPERCTIDCQGTESMRRAFYFSSGEQDSSVVQDLTIRNGYVKSPYAGGALYCSNDSWPKVSNCRLLGCSATDGGAVGCASGAHPLVSGCLMAGNSAGRGGAMYCTGASHPSLLDSVITGNYASGTTSSSGGGGIYCSDSAPTIESCTIASNGAYSKGGGIYGACSPENTIIWGNCAPDGSGPDWWGDGGCYVDCCNDYDPNNLDGFGSCVIICEYGNKPNIGADPLFCDPANCNSAPTTEGDYHICPTSPCAPDQQSVCGLIGALEVGCALLPPPEPLSPPDGAICQPTSGTLDWSDVSGAVGYQVQIGTICGGDSPEYDVTASEYPYHDLQPDTWYYWRVRTKNVCGAYGPWSDDGCFSFTTRYYPVCVGDMNCDGTIDFGDINPFVKYLSQNQNWRLEYPCCDPENGDINCDGIYGQSSFGDINPFVKLITQCANGCACPGPGCQTVRP